MKPQPLELIDIYVDVDTEPHTFKCKGATKEQIKSAVEWLQIENVKLWNMYDNKTITIKQLETGLKLNQKKAFEDVMKK